VKLPSLTLWEGHRLRLFKNREMRGTAGPQREGTRENCTVRSFMIVFLAKYYLVDQIKNKIMWDM
jgi:hypothetical protein